MRKKMTGFKTGAASFYVVMISTLILMIVAVSFATAIMAEITRTANDDLSQSAYDAALAGVEDAKLAIANYQSCIKKGATAVEPTDGGDVTCGEIIYWMEHPDCDMVAHILGRIGKRETGEVLIEETTTDTGGSSNNMNQAYTCVNVLARLSDYRAMLSAAEPYRMIKVELDDGTSADDVEAVRVSWFSDIEGRKLSYTNIANSRVAFQPLASSKAAVPPTIKIQLIQTATNFSLNDLNGTSSGNSTDRAAVFLVPTDSIDTAKTNKEGETSGTESFIGVYDDSIGSNVLSVGQVASTNDHAKDLPYVVYCPEDGTNEFACTALINLPKPIGGVRSNETFAFVVSLPYEQPDTDFALELVCADGKTCGRSELASGGDDVEENAVILNSMQIAIDSTGRANDLYRRIEMRIESGNSASAYPFDAIRLIGDNDNDEVLRKDMTVTAEYGL